MLSLRSGILAQVNKALHRAFCNKGNLLLLLRYCNVHISEAVFSSCSLKNMFLKVLQNSQVFLLEQELPVNFATF